MNIDVSEIEYCKLNVKYEEEVSVVADKREEVVLKFKNVKVPGFRPGKATPQALKVFLKKEIDKELKRELASMAVNNVVAEKQIKPIGQPTFATMHLENSKFNCEFSIHKQPDFELAQYKEFEIPKPGDLLKSEDLAQKMLEDLRVKNGETIAYSENDVVQSGDTVIMNYKSFLNDEEIPSLSGDAQLLSVGRISVPGFDENILGMKVGEKRDFTLKLPETYKPEFANEEVKFSVELVNGSKNEPAGLDDELAKKIGVNTFQELAELVNSTATTRVKDIEKNYIFDQISRRLIENHSFHIPQWISTAEAQINARAAGQDWNSISDEEKEKFISSANDNVKLSLVLQKIMDNEPDAQLSSEEVVKLARENIGKFSTEPEKIMMELLQNNQLSMMFARIKDENTLGFIEKTCKIIE